MKQKRSNSPLLGYNTNVRHDGVLFHIQTEDSGVERPHIITHLFTEGTILATKKTGYADLVGDENLEERVRKLMKEQHRAMFIELRDGVHDETAARILGHPVGEAASRAEPEGPEETEPLAAPPKSPPPVPPRAAQGESEKDGGVRVIVPSDTKKPAPRARPRVEPTPAAPKKASAARSIFETPDENGEFGDELISDKSLDEVILSYLTDEDLD